MKLSRYLLATLRDVPKEAEVTSHQLMIRAGMIRRVASGVYDLMPTGVRVIRKVEQIVRDEMNRANALEVSLPVVQPAELWQESGRWDAYGRELLRFRDRGDRDFVLGPTHEEVITDLMRRDVSSYKQLPVNLYQIHTKFRDEIRPRFGLMRAREFTMKDAYSFHLDADCLDREFRSMVDTYRRIFSRCGLEFRDVEADSGAIGGSASSEFMVLADSGEDAVIFCGTCDYAANLEKAEVRRDIDAPPEATGLPSPEEVPTPGKKSIDEVSGFLGIDPGQMIKTLVFQTSVGPVVACIAGTLEINETKVKNAVGGDWAHLAEPGEVKELFGVEIGFVGPVGLPDGTRIIADYSVNAISDGVTGANRPDLHLRHVIIGRDFEPAIVTDLASAWKDAPCPRCDNGHLEIRRGIEVGHVFKLGTKYSESMGLTVLDANGKSQPVVMGCYGIGIGRTAAAAIEQNHDDSGIIWPRPLAPFDAVVVPLDPKNDQLMEAAAGFYDSLCEAGLDVALDDRQERAGVKLTDAELLGVPVRIVLGKRGYENGVTEVTVRAVGDKQEIPLDETVSAVLALLDEAGQA